MNHDYAHCADFKETCPMDCFRAQLVRDLKNNPQRFTSWIHFSETNEFLFTGLLTANSRNNNGIDNNDLVLVEFFNNQFSNYDYAWK